MKRQPYIPVQPRSHVRLGVSNWGRMVPQCLINYNCEVGFELEIFKILMILLNVTVEIKYSNVPGCGGMGEDGAWNGLLGMLHRNEIDITGNLCQIDESRRNVSWLKYSWPVQQQKQAFLIKAPQMDTAFNIFGPFTVTLWLLIFLSTIAFITLFAVIYKLIKLRSVKSSFCHAVLDVFKIFFGLDCTIIRFDWFCCICFFGFAELLYSSLVTSAVMKPDDIFRPFRDHNELADALVSGKYKLLDYHSSSSYVQCGSKGACEKFLMAQEIHSHFYYNLTSMEADNGTDALLKVLVENANLVLVRSRYTLMTYLDRFTNRSMLWLIDDEASGVTLFSYFYRDNFALSKLIDRALILMGDSKDNIKNTYTSLSKHAVNTKKISGSLSETTIFRVNMFNGHWLFHCIAVTIDLLVFVSEILLVKFGISNT